MATQKASPSVNTVTMDDGRVVEFAGKRKMLKSSNIDKESGEVVIRIDFVNGETRTYNVVSELMARFAAHGAEQKIGDEIAGVELVEDCVIAIDNLLERLEKGEWNQNREGGNSGLNGASILLRGLVELTGKSKDDITKFLAGKSHAEKIALRNNAKLKPIVERLEAEKAAKAKPKDGPTIDSDALLGDLEAGRVTAPALTSTEGAPSAPAEGEAAVHEHHEHKHGHEHGHKHTA